MTTFGRGPSIFTRRRIAQVGVHQRDEHLVVQACHFVSVLQIPRDRYMESPHSALFQSFMCAATIAARRHCAVGWHLHWEGCLRGRLGYCCILLRSTLHPLCHVPVGAFPSVLTRKDHNRILLSLKMCNHF